MDAWESLGVLWGPQETMGGTAGWGGVAVSPSCFQGLGPHPAFPLAQVGTAR